MLVSLGAHDGLGCGVKSPLHNYELSNRMILLRNTDKVL